MKRTATLLTLGLLWAGTAQAQQDRTSGVAQDAIWARDVGDATLTRDGLLNEPAWATAESVRLQWQGTQFIPGGGWATSGGGYDITAPTDPNDATVKFLRKGNVIWIGVESNDRSIGGSPNFFNHDGLVMALIDARSLENALPDEDNPYRPAWGNNANVREVFYTWLNRESASGFQEDSVGMAPTLYGSYVSGNATDGFTIEENTVAGATVVNGVSNDDFNGNAVPTPDGGYTMEFTIDVGTLGFDFEDADGDRYPMTFAVYDLDYAWPDTDNRYRTRAWFQGYWGNSLTAGRVKVGYVYGSPAVTTSSGATPIPEPDLRIPRASSANPITLDGRLSEPIWGNIETQVELQYQMDVTKEQEKLPGIGRFFTHWFRPNASETVPVLDPTVGKFRMFYDGTTLYVGLDTDDAAVNGVSPTSPDETSADGFRISIVDLAPGPLAEGSGYPALQYDVYIDSTGAPAFLNNAAGNAGVRAAVHLKEGTVVADPTDADFGYSIELAIPLDTLGVDFDGDRLLWFGLNFHDGDAIDPAANSYQTWTWVGMERDGGPAIRAYLDPNLIASTPGEDGPAGAALRALGNAPNPFGTRTAVRYELPRAAEVTVEVYDVLGRLVRTVEPGLQTAGLQEATVDAAGLSAGAYVYRVRMDDGTAVSGRMLVVR